MPNKLFLDENFDYPDGTRIAATVWTEQRHLCTVLIVDSDKKKIILATEDDKDIAGGNMMYAEMYRRLAGTATLYYCEGGSPVKDFREIKKEYASAIRIAKKDLWEELIKEVQA